MKDINCDMKGLAREIVEAYRSCARNNLTAYFTIGDKIVNGVVLTGMTENNLVMRLVRELKGEISRSTLQNAALFARKIQDPHRKTLLERAATLDQVLAISRIEDDTKRGHLCSEVKCGRKKLKNLKTVGMAHQLEKQKIAAQLYKATDHDIHKDPRKVVIDLDNAESIADGLARLFQVVGPKIADYLEQAQRRIDKSEVWNPRKVAI